MGYVPPPPENYEETSARLDAARTCRAGAAARARGARRRRTNRPSPVSSSGPPRASDADVDGYVLGAFLHHSATERTRKLLRITGEADAHEYARSLHPHERLAALRSIAREVIEDG